MLILALLHEHDSYGYDLVERLRLMGLSNPARKYCRLAAAGESARVDAAQK